MALHKVLFLGWCTLILFCHTASAQSVIEMLQQVGVEGYEIRKKEKGYVAYEANLERDIPILLDRSNGYLMFEDEGTGGGVYQVEAVKFSLPSGKALLALKNQFFDGLLPEESLRFYLFQSGKLQNEVTEQYLPKLAVKDFFKSEEAYAAFQKIKEKEGFKDRAVLAVSYRLPRYGTRLEAHLRDESLLIVQSNNAESKLLHYKSELKTQAVFYALNKGKDAFERNTLPVHACVPIGAKDFYEDEGLWGNWLIAPLPALAATSTLPSQGTNTYGVTNLGDKTPATAWVEGKKDYGVGEKLSLKLTDGKPQFGEVYGLYGYFYIQNGYAKSEASWKANSRVRLLLLRHNEKPVAYFLLKDAIQPQTLDASRYFWNTHQHSGIKVNGGDTLSFEIVDVYRGDKYKDTAISTFVGLGLFN